MIKYEEARTEISKVKKKVAKDIKTVIEQYNIYIVNRDDVFAARKSDNLDNLVWYMDLSGNLKSKRDLFDDTRKELELDGYILTEENFKQIDNDVNLSRFDYSSAFHLVCKKVTKSVEDVIVI